MFSFHTIRLPLRVSVMLWYFFIVVLRKVTSQDGIFQKVKIKWKILIIIRFVIYDASIVLMECDFVDFDRINYFYTQSNEKDKVNLSPYKFQHYWFKNLLFDSAHEKQTCFCQSLLPTQEQFTSLYSNTLTRLVYIQANALLKPG